MKGKYNSWNIESIKELYALAKEMHEVKDRYERYAMIPGKYEYDREAAMIIDAFLDAIDHNITLSLEAKTYYRIGEPKTYYRIGEPRIADDGLYRPSYNYAEDRPELGVSVVTAEWLNSLKSTFLGAHDDEKIAAKGVYKLKGVQITTGGDNEPLIYVMDWAEKTDIKTFEGLKKAVQ